MAGLAIFQNNKNITITNSIFTNLQSDVAAGGLLIFKENSYITLHNVSVTHCSADNGGGIFILQSNKYITLSHVEIAHNQANVYGAGMYVSEGNDYITLIESNIVNNSALTFGGGVMFNKTNNNITLAGCLLEGNSAPYGGGLFIGYTNMQITITDSLSYRYTTYGSYIYNTMSNTVVYTQDATTPYAIGYVLTFTIGDIGDYETMYVYGENGVILQQFNYDTSDFPGITVPSVYYESPILTIAIISSSASSDDDDGVYDQYYGVEYTITPVLATKDRSITTPTIVRDNAADTKGAGAYFYSNNINILVLNAIIEGNIATASGGGMFLQLVQANTLLIENIFNNNAAGANGGAISILAGNYGFQIIRNTWQNNYALTNGGAVYIGTTNGNGLYTYDNEITFTSNTFTGNIGLSNGGALFLDTENEVILMYSVIDTNGAYLAGGGICLNSLNHFYLYNNTITNNVASEGGGLSSSSSSQNHLVLQSMYFAYNAAKSAGGGMILDDSTDTFFLDTSIFFQNYAYFGGGIAALVVDLWYMIPQSHLLFQGNIASRGSALFCYPLAGEKGTNVLQNITFRENIALSGSTVYWVYGTLMLSEPPGLQSDSLKWIDNIAMYGDRWGTQAVHLITPSTYQVTVYGGNLNPPLILTMSDYYNQSMPISNDTAVFPTLITSNVLQKQSSIYGGSSLPNCQGFVSSLTGDDVGGVVFTEGQAIFDELQAYCAPGGNFTVGFQADLGLMTQVSTSLASSFYITTTTLFTFRNCVEGEYEKNGACNICPTGSYSLIVSNDVDSCLDCSQTKGIRKCYGNQIILHEGYWRRYPQSTAIFSCPLGSQSCLGGNLTGQALCGLGYTGPLCSVCDSGYYLNDGSCQGCKGDSAVSVGLIFIIVVVVLGGLVGMVLYGYCRALQPVMIDAGPTFLEVWALWLKTKYGDMTVQAKIIISTYQIVIAASTIFAINMPSAFSSIANSLKIFNFNFSSIFPIGCAADFNFMFELLWTTLCPIFATFALFICFSCEYLYLRRWIQANPNRQKGEKSRQFEATKNKYLNIFFYLTYLILPSVTTTIFQLFVCQNIDPNNEDDSQYDLYLKADMTISCQSDYYKSWLVYGIAMIFVYPIGIPAMYLVLLYRSRDEIMSRSTSSAPKASTPPKQSVPIEPNETSAGDKDDRTNNPMLKDDLSAEEESKKESGPSAAMANPAALTVAGVTTTIVATTAAAPTMSAHATRIQFLWRAYEPRYWYWEVLETGRRIILTAVLSVVSPGSSEQNLLAIILSLMFIKLYSYFRPYLLDRNDVLAEMGQIQVFFTFLCAMTINNNLLEKAYSNAMDGLLIVINFSVMFIVLHNSMRTFNEKYGVLNSLFVVPVVASSVSKVNNSPDPSAVPQSNADGSVQYIEMAPMKKSSQQ